jgi:hypothetical protein
MGILRWITAVSLLILVACSEKSGAAAGQVGVARIWLTNAPADARCLKITVSGVRTVRRSFDLSSGETPVLLLRGLPIGEDTFVALAYGSVCNSVDSAAVATWESDSMVVSVSLQSVAEVSLVMRRIGGQANVSVDFQDEDASDACASGSNRCDLTVSDCVNDSGGYRCACKQGFRDRDGTCLNIDECVEGPHDCDPNAICTDQAPGFTCTCKTGFSGSGKSCSDINECVAGTDMCNRATQDCVNTLGSFSCNCKTGYQKDGTGNCVDINECAAGTHNCDANATCMDQTPGFRCACNSGYAGSGTLCSDINECASNTHNCNLQISTCENSFGGFRCKNINECQSGASDCNTNAVCADINCETDLNNSCKNPNAAGFTCACRAGFTGAGHGANGCTCDLSGYWYVRQKVSSAKAITGALTSDAYDYYSWSLARFRYDGTTLAMELKGCGQEGIFQEIHASVGGLLNEIYSVYTPIADDASFTEAPSVERPHVLPGSQFDLSTMVWVKGLQLNHSSIDPWPTDHSDITWTDADSDGESGYSTWSMATTKRTRTHPDMTFSYLPTDTSYPIGRRAACFSGAKRMKSHFSIKNVDSSCGILTGDYIVDSDEGHIRSCTIVPKSQWDTTDIECTRDHWATAERCTSDEVTSFDNEAHSPNNSSRSATFEIIKAKSLNESEPSCSDARAYFGSSG